MYPELRREKSRETTPARHVFHVFFLLLPPQRLLRKLTLDSWLTAVFNQFACKENLHPLISCPISLPTHHTSLLPLLSPARLPVDPEDAFPASLVVHVTQRKERRLSAAPPASRTKTGRIKSEKKRTNILQNSFRFFLLLHLGSHLFSRGRRAKKSCDRD